MRIKNETGGDIIIKDGEELIVKRSLLWLDEEREIDYISIGRVEGGEFVREERTETEEDDDEEQDEEEEKEELSDEVREMMDKSSVLKQRKEKDKEGEKDKGGSEKPDEVTYTKIQGTQCPSCERDDFDNKRGVKAHHWRVHGAIIREWEYPCPKDGCQGGSDSMKGLKQHYTKTHGERYDDVYGDEPEPEFYCHYSRNGERCDHPCKNLRGLKIHWGKEHKDKEFILPEESGQ